MLGESSQPFFGATLDRFDVDVSAARSHSGCRCRHAHRLGLRRLVGPLRPRSTLLKVRSAQLVGAVTAAMLLLGGCAGSGEQEVAVGQDSTAPETTGPGDWEPATDPEEITSIAQRAAARSGEPAPSDIEWVVTERSAAVELMSGSVVDEADGPALLIQMRGDFDAGPNRRPYTRRARSRRRSATRCWPSSSTRRPASPRTGASCPTSGTSPALAKSTGRADEAAPPQGLVVMCESLPTLRTGWFG